jgi:hypothetical protein
MVARRGIAAKLGFKAHRDMFQQACGFQLANQGTDTRTLQAYFGHRDIQHTAPHRAVAYALREPLARLTIISRLKTHAPNAQPRAQTLRAYFCATF